MGIHGLARKQSCRVAEVERSRNLRTSRGKAETSWCQTIDESYSGQKSLLFPTIKHYHVAMITGANTSLVRTRGLRQGMALEP